MLPVSEVPDLAIRLELAMVQTEGSVHGVPAAVLLMIISALAGSNPVPFNVIVVFRPAIGGFGFGVRAVSVGATVSVSFHAKRFVKTKFPPVSSVVMVRAHTPVALRPLNWDNGLVPTLAWLILKLPVCGGVAAAGWWRPGRQKWCHRTRHHGNFHPPTQTDRRQQRYCCRKNPLEGV